MMKLFAKMGIVRLVLFAALGMVTVSEVGSAVQIGDDYGGGVVFFVDETGQHGLVAAKADFPEGMTWSDAYRACDDLVSDTYSDWFLPNKKQLNQLYINRTAVGGFSDYIYWSSTENSDRNAWNQNFNNGCQKSYVKSFWWAVRAVRAF